MKSTDNKRLSRVLRKIGDVRPPDMRRLPPVRGGDCFSLRVAADRATREKAHRLVYEQYLDKGYSQSRPSRAWVTLHDALPETVKLVVEKEGEVVATGTVVPDSQLRLPADEMYSVELDALRRNGRRPVEVISLAAGGSLQDSRVTLVKLFAAIHLVAREDMGATDLVITVNPRHVPFYKRVLLFEELGGERECGKVAGAPAVLLRLSVENADRYTREAGAAFSGDCLARTLYPLIAAEQGDPRFAESIEKSIRAMDEADFGYFFIGLSDVLEKSKPSERRYLQSRYPAYEFARLFLTTAVCC